MGKVKLAAAWFATGLFVLFVLCHIGYLLYLFVMNVLIPHWPALIVFSISGAFVWYMFWGVAFVFKYYDKEPK